MATKKKVTLSPRVEAAPNVIEPAHDGTLMICVKASEIPVSYWDTYRQVWIVNGNRPTAPNVGGLDIANSYHKDNVNTLVWMVFPHQDIGEICP